jgi:hypothetical protein
MFCLLLPLDHSCLQRGHFSIGEDDILQAAAEASGKSAGDSASVSAISLESVGDALEVSCFQQYSNNVNGA